MPVQGNDAVYGGRKHLESQRGPRSPTPWSRIAIAAVLSLVVLGGWLIGEHRKANFPVHVLNGFPGELSLRVDDGEVLSFNDVGRIEISVPEGEHRVEVLSPWQETFQFTLRRGYVERFGEPPVAAINPGGLATLLWQEQVYSSAPDLEYEPPTRLYAGKSFVLIQDVDYPFAPFPDEIRTQSHEVRKTSVQEMFLAPADAYAWFLAEQPADGVDYLESWILAAPQDEYADWYSTLAIFSEQQERGAKFLKDRRTLDPVNLEWHRAYQSLLEALPDRRPEMIDEYRAIAADAPDDPDLLYLAGRVEPDAKRAAGFFRGALEIDAEHLYSLRAMGYRDLTLGRYDEAANSLARCMIIQSDDPQTLSLYHDALHGARRDGELEQQLRALLDVDDPSLMDFDSAELLLHLLIRRGDVEEAQAFIENVAAMEAVQPADAPTDLAIWLRAAFFYATEDWNSLSKHARNVFVPSSWDPTLQLWLTSGTDDMGAAPPAEAAGWHRLLHGLAKLRRVGAENIDDAWFAEQQEAIAEMSFSGVLFQDFERLWNATTPPTQEDVDRLEAIPEVKRVLLTALAIKFPERRTELAKQADHMNFEVGFPYHLIRSLTN